MIYSLDKSVNLFHKGWQKRQNNNPATGFEDPTYLGFRLLFFPIGIYNHETGYNDNSLFTSKNEQLEGAERYLEAIGMNKRAAMIKRFKDLMLYMTKTTPWYIQEVEGVKSLWSIDKDIDTFDPFRAKEAELSFKCLESIDLRITLLADLYRKATFDYKNMREILPINLREFRCELQIAEFRKFHTIANKLSGVNSTANSLQGNPSEIIEDNTRLLKELENYISVISFDLRHCIFDFEESLPEDSYNLAGDYSQATQSFKINVGKIYKEKNQYSLQEILLLDDYRNSEGSLIKGNVLENDPDIEKEKRSQFLPHEKIDFDTTAQEKLDRNRKSSLQRRIDRGVQRIETRLSNELQRLEQETRNLVNQKIFNNDIANFIRDFVDRVTTGELGEAFDGNPSINYHEGNLGKVFDNTRNNINRPEKFNDLYPNVPGKDLGGEDREYKNP